MPPSEQGGAPRDLSRTTRVTVLGSGTLLPDHRHHSAAHMVEWNTGAVLLDCGAGTLHGMDRYGVDWKRIDLLVLSHFHTDHMGDLASILWAREHGLRPSEASPLTLVGPRGMVDRLHGLARAHGEWLREPTGGMRVVEVEGEGMWSDPEGGMGIHHHPTPHTEESLAFRIETPAGEVGYTGDTGPCAPLASFFRGVRVLVAECAVADGTEVPNHLSPIEVARLAQGCEPEILLLTHLYPEVDRSRVTDLIARAGYTGRVEVAEDGMVAEVPMGRPVAVHTAADGV